MDILVMLEENPDHSPVLAHVNSVPSPLATERPARDIVTLYGVPSAETLALALAAAVESHRTGEGHNNVDAIRHLGVSSDRGAVGDAAWRDAGTGELVTRDLEIPFEILQGTAAQLLGECGQLIRRLVAGLSMPDWPEGPAATSPSRWDRSWASRRPCLRPWSPCWIASVKATRWPTITRATETTLSVRESEGLVNRRALAFSRSHRRPVDQPTRPTLLDTSARRPHLSGDRRRWGHATALHSPLAGPLHGR